MDSEAKMVRPGMMLGRHELLMPVASGGMATVWAARRRLWHRTDIVAIKTMLPALADSAAHRRMFIEEAKLAELIQHPNVCRSFEHGEHEGILYIVMEWVEGETLAALLAAQDGPMPLPLALRVALQLSAGLRAAHELRDERGRRLLLAHRDVSPQNILCADNGGVKLVDFGVAKSANSSGPMDGALMGKISYMAPEQTWGGVVDQRTDVFALGIVLYRMTTGRHPFTGESAVATIENIVARPMPSPREADPSFPPQVEDILARCLQKDPADRYPTMAALGWALGRAQMGASHKHAELGTFVRSAMSADSLERRAALREAIRVSDESYALDEADTMIIYPSMGSSEPTDRAVRQASPPPQESAPARVVHHEVTFPSAPSWPSASRFGLSWLWDVSMADAFPDRWSWAWPLSALWVVAALLTVGVLHALRSPPAPLPSATERVVDAMVAPAPSGQCAEPPVRF